MGDTYFDIGLPEKLGNNLSKNFLLNEELFEFVGDLLIESCVLKTIVFIEKKQSFWNVEIRIEGFLNTFCDRCGDPLKVMVKGIEIYYLKRKERNKNSQNENVIFISSKKTDFNVKTLLQEACFLLFPITRKHQTEDCNQSVLINLEKSNKTVQGQTISSQMLKDLKQKLKK